ncbi:hypothetical protein [Spiroplasma endosymbiont of Stenodema calcarata]|uniref:hypothetical protein n=1 Tax=Spiroplasma endosymbiont of Stenodema calcarata TaxID=3139328 RepID=UPI003CCAC287
MSKDLKEMKKWLNNEKSFNNVEIVNKYKKIHNEINANIFSCIESEEFSNLNEKMFQESINLPHIKEIIERLSQD